MMEVNFDIHLNIILGGVLCIKKNYNAGFSRCIIRYIHKAKIMTQHQKSHSPHGLNLLSKVMIDTNLGFLIKNTKVKINFKLSYP